MRTSNGKYERQSPEPTWLVPKVHVVTAKEWTGRPTGRNTVTRKKWGRKKVQGDSL